MYCSFACKPVNGQSSCGTVKPSSLKISTGFDQWHIDTRFFDKGITDYFGKVSCCMNEFTAKNKGKKVSLEVASKKSGFDFDSAAAHDAIHDCQATLSVWQWLNK